MDSDTPEPRANPARSAAAFAVHIFTACGAGCALLALTAAVNGQWAAMFVWLGIALCIDGIDGTFARRLQVAKLLPRWSGDILDLVVDILNYVFVPAYALATSGLLPKPAAIPLGLLIVVTGALYFADRLMKTSDYYFRGFPAVALAAWAALGTAAVAQDLNPPLLVGPGLCPFGVYFVVIGFFRRH